MATHRLKCWQEYFNDVATGHKTFEVRQNDRNFQVGDCLVLEEITHGDSGNLYRSGRTVDVVVTYIADLSPFVDPKTGFGKVVGMGIRLVGQEGEGDDTPSDTQEYDQPSI